MNLIKLDDLNAIPLEEIRRKLDEKYDKMTIEDEISDCLLYTSPSPRDGLLSRMPSSA